MTWLCLSADSGYLIIRILRTHWWAKKRSLYPDRNVHICLYFCPAGCCVCFFYLFAQWQYDKPYEAKMRNIGKTATFNHAKRIKTICFTWIIYSSAEMPILPFSLIRRPTIWGGPLIECPHYVWDHGAAEGAHVFWFILWIWFIMMPHFVGECFVHAWVLNDVWHVVVALVCFFIIAS